MTNCEREDCTSCEAIEYQAQHLNAAQADALSEWAHGRDEAIEAARRKVAALHPDRRRQMQGEFVRAEQEARDILHAKGPTQR